MKIAGIEDADGHFCLEYNEAAAPAAYQNRGLNSSLHRVLWDVNARPSQWQTVVKPDSLAQRISKKLRVRFYKSLTAGWWEEAVL